jgi:hypothetical protein
MSERDQFAEIMSTSYDPLHAKIVSNLGALTGVVCITWVLCVVPVVAYVWVAAIRYIW